MDYPDENEEFELQYQDELEMLDEFQTESNHVDAAITISDGYDGSTNQTDIAEQLFSTQLSQITTGEGSAGGSQDRHVAGPVNRRLFGTPRGGQQQKQRVASTPMTAKATLKTLTSIDEVIGNIDDTPLPSTSLALGAGNVLRESNALNGEWCNNKRRLERDLFGDIDDLYQNETYEDPMAKKARTEEECDMAIIERIIKARKQHSETHKNYRSKDYLERLKTVHDHKMRNLSHLPPKWPFLLLRRSDQERIYVRYHSDGYETKALNEVRCQTANGDSLLGERKQQVWAAANEIMFKRLSTPTQEATPAPTITAAMPANTEVLWVQKYKPRKYMDLLSDETTNRSLLYWLKMWDKIVFGKEFQTTKHEEIDASKLSTFNKRTGRFESNGGWRKHRKTQQTLNTNTDELGRPMQKVALLCGPPGLGKTTLAHTIARHAGYAVRELNASDDRTPEAFRIALENGTQMASMLNENAQPNCIVLDEIDGAPKQSIEFLVKFVTDSIASKAKAKTTDGKVKRNVLKRPIICICNDLYNPALRPLRQIAFVVTFPPIDSARLADRLMQIAQAERIKTDYGSLIALAEKSGNDVRSCVSTMEFFNAQKKVITLFDVLNNNLGLKDRHQGLFDIWRAVFSIKRPTKQLVELHQRDNEINEAHITTTDMSTRTRVQNVLDVVHGQGDYEILMQGVYENFLQQKMPDPNMDGIAEALQWFSFNDLLLHQINHLQNYTVYSYLQFGFVTWHLLFASLAWPKINFPTRGFEFQQKANTHRSVVQSLRKGISPCCIGAGRQSVATLLLDTVPLVKRVLSPTLRSVAVQLLSKKEQSDLQHTVGVMVDFGLKYIQIKSTESAYVFQTEPDIEMLVQFSDGPGITLTYFGRQLIAREVELELVRRATPKRQDDANNSRKPLGGGAKKVIPNHLRTLQPKRVQSNANATSMRKEVVTKDFFGRVQQKSFSAANGIAGSAMMLESKKDPIVKSPIWYRYKEGFNNAVRKDINLNELL